MTHAYLPTSRNLKSGLSILHYTPPHPPRMSTAPTPQTPPPPAPTNCLRTLYDVLHEVHGIKIHCNDELIFVMTKHVQKCPRNCTINTKS